MRPAHWLTGLRNGTWHSTAPAEMVEAYVSADGQEGWEAWTDYLEERRGRPSLVKLLPNGERALLWGMPVALAKGETAELVRQLGLSESFRKRQRRRRWADVLASWLDAASISTALPAYAYECLAWTYALPRLPNCVGENLWWRLVNHLATTAREAGAADSRRDALVGQMLAGELPLALAYQIPEIRACHDSLLTGWSVLSEGLNTLADVDGIPSSVIVPILPALTASWTRSRAVVEQIGGALWNASVARRYELVLLSLARLATVDDSLWRAVDGFDLEKPTQRLMRHLASGKFTRRKQGNGKKLPSPAMHSEQQRFGLMRSNWLTRSPRLTIDYADRGTQLELAAAGETLCSGSWRLQVRLNGESRNVTGEWETVCWHSDKDVDFLEIEAPLGEGLRVQRQVLLARKDEVLLLADAVLASPAGRIEYRASLPVCAHVGFHGAEETCEGHLVGDVSRALVLPLGLAEWRSGVHPGALEMTSDGLGLRQSCDGAAVYAALFFDLNGKRSKEACTWRQLTVAEQRTARSADTSVGYRAQVGKTNWLIYRSLAAPGIRSVLGQQVKAEFLFARMKRGGDCVRLLETEPIDS